MVVTLSNIIFVLILMSGEQTNNLLGWKREEVLFIFGYSMIAMSIFSTVAINLYGFGDKYIIQGQLDRVLLRPLDSLLQVIFESFNLEAMGSMLVGIFVIYFSSSALGINFGLLDILWLIISGISGGTILISVFIAISTLSFFFEDRFGIAAPVFNLINFSRYPLPIFNSTIRFVLTWVLPFGFVAFYPATHFLGRGEFALACYASPLVAIIVFIISRSFWHLGIEKYGSTGT